MHDWCPIYPLLCLDYFGVKYFGKQHVKHLMAVLIERTKSTTIGRANITWIWILIGTTTTAKFTCQLWLM